MGAPESTLCGIASSHRLSGWRPSRRCGAAWQQGHTGGLWKEVEIGRGYWAGGTMMKPLTFGFHRK
jgi:hypothetical protein